MSSRDNRDRQRLRLAIAGTVQGVGFRPHVYRLARSQHIAGFVTNTASGVVVEAEGNPPDIKAFVRRIIDEAPPHAIVASTQIAELEPSGADEFRIQESRGGEPSAWILPDLATCPDCLDDISDPANRRFQYPFTNCTHCGPRFSIIRSLPYDRDRTTMRDFQQCAECAGEYADPADRRFHAQPNACPACGPQIWLSQPDGVRICGRSDALEMASEAIRSGKIIAAKGLGGFHLIALAGSIDAVRTLRERKNRGAKPFAIMIPGIDDADKLCEVGRAERAALGSREAPIVLVRMRRPTNSNQVLENPHIAPGNDRLGLMLPYTPLHHLLLRRIDEPVVATSGNLSDEPICTRNDEARERLGRIADLFLMHDRPIERPVDDSVVQIVCGQRQVLRRSRGFAPLPVSLPSSGEQPEREAVLAVGAHQKNTVALVRDGGAFVSQHVGDLDTLPAMHAFESAAEDLPMIYQESPRTIAHDLHPDYASTQFAKTVKSVSGSETTAVQHHVAHALSLLAETDITGPTLAFTWDGTGLGTDGSIWGGECFAIDHQADPAHQIRRVASLDAFQLVGGDATAREPRRSALGMWTACGKPDKLESAVSSLFDEHEFRIIQAARSKSLSTHVTTSAGRLFDGFAALILGMGRVSYEGQAAVALEDWAWRSAQRCTVADLPATPRPP